MPPLSPTDLPAPPAELALLAIEVASEAAEFVRTRRRAHFEIDVKSSPTDMVTEVDTATDTLIRERLTARRPDDGLLTEEAATVTGIAAGTYTFTATAVDNSGAKTTSTAAVVTVKTGNTAPTVALTTPANKVQLSFASVPPFGGALTLSTGLGATTELSATVGGTIEDAEGLSGFGVGIKQIIGRGSNWAFALAGSVYQVGEGSRDTETLYSMSALGSACSDARCGVMVSGGIHMVGVSGEEDTLTMVSLGLSAGSKTTRFLAEIMAGGPSGEDSAAFALVGVRLGGKRTAVDLALVTVLGETGDVPFLPVLNIHTRL